MTHILIVRSNLHFKRPLRGDEIDVLKSIIGTDEYFHYEHRSKKLEDNTGLSWINANKYLDQLDLLSNSFHSLFGGYQLVVQGSKTGNLFDVKDQSKITFDHRNLKISPCKFVFKQIYRRKS